MKYTLYICSILFLLSGCHQPSSQRLLDEAERLTRSCPDSALSLLDECLFPEKLPAKERAKYGWLWAKASSEAGKSFTQDTLLEEAIRYYTAERDSLKVMECYQLAAEQQRLINDNQKALDYYLNAENFLPSGADSLKQTVYRLIMQQALAACQYETTRLYAHKMLNLSNIKWQIFALYYMALSFTWKDKEESDSSFYYMEKCIAWAETHPDNFLPHYLRNAVGHPRLPAAEALRRLRKSAQLEGESSNELLGIAAIFLRSRQLDSTAYYLHKAEQKYAQEWSRRGKEYVSLRNEMAQIRACLQYAREETDFRQPIGAFNDSLYFSSRNNCLSWEEQSILQQRRVRRDLYFQRQQQHAQLLLLSALFLLILAAIGVVLYAHRKRNRWLEAEERAETLQRLLDEATLSDAENKSDERFFKRILLQQLGIIRLIATTPTDHNRDLLQQIARISQGEAPTDSMLVWSDLYPIIDSVYDAFYSKLKEHYGTLLNEKEMQLCCLLRADFSTKEISIVSQQSPRTVYQRKTDIRRKLGMEEKENIIFFIRQRLSL